MPELIMIPFRLFFGLTILLGLPWILGFMAGRPGRFWVLSFIFFLGTVLFPPVVVLAWVMGQPPAECGMLGAAAVVVSPPLAFVGLIMGGAGFNLARQQTRNPRTAPFPGKGQ